MLMGILEGDKNIFLKRGHGNIRKRLVEELFCSLSSTQVVKQSHHHKNA